VVVSGACNRVTNCADLTVVLPPSIESQPASQVVYVDSNAVFSVSATANGTLTYQWRFNDVDLPGRISPTLTITGARTSDEGDYTVVIRNSICSVTSSVATLTLFRDFGDAPAPAYPTQVAANGARHLIVPDYYLGSGIDAEGDGQPNSSATGDDSGGAGDEDGVTILTPMAPGLEVLIQVVASADGQLDAWLDFDGNGSWADAGDQIFTNQALTAGINFLTFSVPLTITPLETYARFRLSGDGGLSFDGPAADGEVEDYRVSLVPIIVLPNAKAAVPEPEPIRQANSSLNRSGIPAPTAVIELSGDDIIISFRTGFSQRYRVERIDTLQGDAWVAVGPEILGTGDMVRITDVGGGCHTSRFYRVALLIGTIGPKP
jgi:hypothetical protein